MVVNQRDQAAQALPLGRGGEIRLVGECVDVIAEHMARARERPRDLPAPVGDGERAARGTRSTSVLVRWIACQTGNRAASRTRSSSR